MAITILCPGCKTRLTLDDYRAGTTFGCPKCETAIGVPVVVESSPAPLPPSVPPAPRPLPPATPPPPIDLGPDEEEEEEEEEIDTPVDRYRRRRKRRARNRILILVSVVALLGIACVILVPKAFQRLRDSSRSSVSSMNSTERKLVGVWTSSETAVFLELDFRRDGTFRWHFDAPALDVGAQDASGTWSARDGVVTLKVDKISGPNDARLDGTVTNTIEIVSIDESQLILQATPKLQFPPLKRKSRE